MLHQSVISRAHPNHSKSTHLRGMWWRPTRAKYPNLDHFVRRQTGRTKYEHQPSRLVPVVARFNPENVVNTKGTSGFAMNWWHHHRLLLPNLPPEGWKAPEPRGSAAWPPTWTPEHAQRWLSLEAKDLREALFDVITRAVHVEVMRDGYDLRGVDYEGKPTTELPERVMIESFVFEEITLRDRILEKVLDNELRIPVTSAHRKEIRSVETLLRHIETVLDTFRAAPDHSVPPAVKDFLSAYPVQPKFGFQLALPQDPRPALEREWERLFLHDWQYGKAVYQPRSRENPRGNIVWLRLEKEWAERERHAAQFGVPL